LRKTIKIASVVLATGLVLAGCQSNSTPAPSATPAPGKIANVDWKSLGYDYQQTRNVPLDQVTKENVKDLGIAWQMDYKKIDAGIPGGIQNFPVEVDGVIYTTTSFNHVFANDAKTGKELWHWQPEKIAAFKNFGLNGNRGVAYGDGKIFMVTIDCNIVALDAKTGKLVKQVAQSDSVKSITVENGYYQTSTPIYYDGKLYVGSSGGDNGVRGFVMAYNGSDLSPAWDQPFWTIPPKGQDWLKGEKLQGGGAVWMPVTVDPETGLIYFATGNPAPDFYGADRPGANPDTDSVVAVDAKTGKKVWAQQEVSHDLWDYDAASSPMLLKTKVGGVDRKIVVEGGKNGQWYAWDAKTGEVVYNGVPFVKIQHDKAPTPEGVLVFPGALGGENYAPETFDPQTNYVLIPAVEQGMIVKAAKDIEDIKKNGVKPGVVDFGTTIATPTDTKPTGNITAIDVNTGKVAYKIDTASPQRGGLTSTSSGLAFFGDQEGNLNAIDIKAGKIIWSFQTGGPIAAAPTIYAVDGKEYIAVAVGGTSTSGGGKQARMVVFTLGADKTQATAEALVASAGHGGTTAPSADFKAQEGKWIAFDATKKTVDLLMIGNYDATLSGMNFNGYGNGDMKVTVPKDWKVNVRVKNSSPQLPHSVMITPESAKGTSANFKEAFPGAFSPDPLAGFTGNISQDFSFTPDKAGTFLIWCAIPGHGSMGMYDMLIVDDKASEPKIELPKK
jgi:alcohol dehydrogenase (cytochrome c)